MSSLRELLGLDKPGAYPHEVSLVLEAINARLEALEAQDGLGVANVLQIAPSGVVIGEPPTFNGKSQRFTFDKSIVKAKPAAGRVRINNAKPAVASELYVSLTNAQGEAIKAWLESFPNGSGTASGIWLRAFSRANPLVFTIWQVGEYLENAEGYLQIKVSGGKHEAAFAETLADLVLELFFELPGGGVTGALLARGVNVRTAEWVTKLLELEITRAFTLNGIIRYKPMTLTPEATPVETLTLIENTSLIVLLPTLNIEIDTVQPVLVLEGMEIKLINRSAFKIVLVNESGSGSGNTFKMPGGVNFTIEPEHSVELVLIAGAFFMVANA